MIGILLEKTRELVDGQLPATGGVMAYSHRVGIFGRFDCRCWRRLRRRQHRSLDRQAEQRRETTREGAQRTSLYSPVEKRKSDRIPASAILPGWGFAWQGQLSAGNRGDQRDFVALTQDGRLVAGDCPQVASGNRDQASRRPTGTVAVKLQ